MAKRHDDEMSMTSKMSDAHEDRVSDQKESVEQAHLDVDKAFKNFAMDAFNNVLPKLPEIPGYHLCWISTTNQYDSLMHRESWGYTRVKAEELPGFERFSLSQGNYAGCIGLNELILAKIPTDLYQRFMRVAHHDRPYGEEEKIRETTRYIQETVRDGGGDVYLGDGTSELVNSRRRREPTFSE